VGGSLHGVNVSPRYDSPYLPQRNRLLVPQGRQGKWGRQDLLDFCFLSFVMKPRKDPVDLVDPVGILSIPFLLEVKWDVGSFVCLV